MPAKLKSLSDINNPTEKKSLVCTKICLVMLSSGKLSQGSLAQVQQVVYFSSSKHMQVHAYPCFGGKTGDNSNFLC